MTPHIAKVRKLTQLLLASIDGYERHPNVYDKLDCDAKLLADALVELRIGLGRDQIAPDPEAGWVHYSRDYIAGYRDAAFAFTTELMTSRDITDAIVADLGERVREEVEAM